MKKILFISIISIAVVALTLNLKPVKETIKNVSKGIISHQSLIYQDSLTIHSRVKVPEGFKRVKYPKGSFENYIRHYNLKPYGSTIVNYDGSEYYWQKGHIGILDITVPKNGLQQCADALIRVRSEYLWAANRKQDIGFNFTSGHHCSWHKYAQGYRPKINGNKVTFSKTASANHTKENFYNYLNLIYMYSGTLSLSQELKPITSANNLKIGDLLIKGGSPGHIVMLGDEAINKNGDKLFLLFQGNTPAQSVHLVKNLEDAKISPWYSLRTNTVIPVSNYTFYNSKFARFK